MSRSTVAKSRAEKGGKSTSAPTPAITHEIVPGKYNDQDWNFMLDHDDGDELVADIVQDICSVAMDIIYKNYLEKQLIPFTVVQAKDALLQIIEWQFLSRDEGEADTHEDPFWMEDEEPEPAMTDCWAQGSVPQQVVQTPRTPAIQEEPETQEEEEEQEEGQQEEEEGQKPEEEEEQQQEELQQEDTELTQVEPSAAEQVDEEPQAGEAQLQTEGTYTIENPSEAQQEEQSSAKKRKKKYKPHTGQLKSGSFAQITESLESTEMKMMMEEMVTPSDCRSPDTVMMQMPSSCHSLVKLQASRPPGARDVLYDEAGNIMSINKINPARLPSHRVKTQFQVIDPDTEAAQARLEAMRTGRYLKTTHKPQPPKNSPRGTIHRIGKSGGQNSKVKDPVTALPPPLLETMELSPGVVVREGDRVKKGPRQHPKKTELIAMSHRGLRPVSMKNGDPAVAVAEILGRKTPVVRPLSQTPPIPPIAPHPPPSQMVGGQ